MKKILDDIYSFTLKLPFPATPELTLYFIDGEKPAIVDTGLGDQLSMDTISLACEKKGKHLNDISYIINTHEHIEHFGGNLNIKKTSRASVIASKLAAPIIENYHDITLGIKKKLQNQNPNIFKMLENLINHHLTITGSKVDEKVDDGDIIDLGNIKLRVIATPGHTNGHICLYDEEKKVLFSGDHLISTGSTFVGYYWRDFTTTDIIYKFNNRKTGPGNISLYIESLKKLQSLDLTMILPSHGPPITDPYEQIAQGIKGKEDRGNKFYAILKKEKEIDLEKLTAMAYNEEKSNFLQQGAALGYLERLSKSGKIKAEVKDETLFFKII